MGCSLSSKEDLEVRTIYRGRSRFISLPNDATIGTLLDNVNGGHRQRWLVAKHNDRIIRDRSTTLVENGILRNDMIYVEFSLELFKEHITSIMQNVLGIPWTGLEFDFDNAKNFDFSKNYFKLGDILVKYGLSDEFAIVIEDDVIDVDDTLIEIVNKSNNSELIKIINKRNKIDI